MRSVDYQAWVAIRAIGEAMTRLRQTAPREIGRFMLAAFKGVPLSFRSWDHQLRQPILIAQPWSQSRPKGASFISARRSTRGTDQPESACRFR